MIDQADIATFIGYVLGCFGLGLASGWLLLYFKKATGLLK